MTSHQRRHAPDRNGRGAALVTALAILTVVTILAAAAFATATWEARMAQDFEYRDRAFIAAEYALSQALRSPSLAPTYTRAAPLVTSPARVPGTTDEWAYRLYYDAGAGTSPASGDEVPGMEAYHFVVEATGRSLRGAEDEQVLGFYVLRPVGWIPGACGGTGLPCVELPPRRTWWREKGLD